jgi:integrase
MRYTKNPRYTYVKNSTYYFSKTVPTDVRSYYSKPRIIICLHTQHKAKAAAASNTVLAKLEDYWLKLRLKDMNIPAAHLLSASNSITSGMPTIEDAAATYLSIKGHERAETFHKGTKRNIGYLNDCLGVRSLDHYSTSDAGKFRDWLKDTKQLSSASIHRIFSTIKAVVGFAIKELGLDLRNPFAGVYLPRIDASKRQPISKTNIKRLQQECQLMDDDIRHLVALLSHTGMRLAEATGLHIKDLILDGDVPYVIVRPHSWRPLKTKSSERQIPLVGLSLWAAQKIKATQTDYCFPRYTNEITCNSNSASVALNKWIRTVIGSGNVIHGFRHAFRDSLRSVKAPLDMVDMVGGWSLRSVGQGYGNGYPLEVMQKVMKEALEA